MTRRVTTVFPESLFNEFCKKCYEDYDNPSSAIRKFVSNYVKNKNSKDISRNK